MRVKEIMHHVMKIPFWSSISEAARMMDEKSIGSVLIEENGRVIGIMTERDILRKIVAKGKNPDKVKVKDIMNYPIETIDANEDIVDASKIMDEKRIRRLVVVENGKIVGKITANSISRNLKYMMIREPQIYTRAEY